ncbi:MAG: hypothetical protein V4581_16495 [Bacteroidota bacterium]
MSEILHKLNFRYEVLKRMATIAPRKSKKIKMLYIEYVNAADTGSQILIKYRFRNALWYTINDISTINTRALIPRDDEQKELNLTVHGFFRKNIYTLLLKPEYIHVIKIMQL